MSKMGEWGQVVDTPRAALNDDCLHDHAERVVQGCHQLLHMVRHGGSYLQMGPSRPTRRYDPDCEDW